MSKQVVYQIYCNNKDECDYIYVGSTANFTSRKSKHKSTCKNKDKCKMKVYQTINEFGGWENWTMEILEECLELSKIETQQKEEEWRVKLNAQLNSQKAYIEDYEIQRKDYNLQRKEFREENKEKIREQKKEHYENNKEQIREKQAEYREENREKINEQKKQHYQENKDKVKEKVNKYREENKEKISEKKKLKVQCNCGAIFRKEDKARHFRTVAHQDFVSSNPDVEINLEPLEIS